jgi:hypothetical protein
MRHTNPRTPALRTRLALLAALGAASATACDSGEVVLPTQPAAAGSESADPSANELPPGHPPIPERSGPVELVLEPPDGWVVEEPANDLRVAQWRFGAADEDPGVECAQFRFAGGGGVDDNISRWMSQIESPDGGSALLQAQRETVTVSAAITAHTVYLPGTYVVDGAMSGSTTVRYPGWALYGVVLDLGGRLEFLKCVGERSALDAAVPAIRAMWERAALR